MKIYESAVEKMMKHFTVGEYEQDVLSAKEVFFKSAGIFDEEHPDFEMKMSQFSDWYLFSRRLEGAEITPIDVVAAGKAFEIERDEMPVYKSLSENRHSLFEFLKAKGDDVHIKDLFSNEKLVIRDSQISVGFNKDEIFEARLIPNEENFVFAGAFCFHPPQASRFINKEIKKIKKLKGEEQDEAREALIQRLFRMRYKHEQYRHVELGEIYSNDSKLRL